MTLCSHADCRRATGHKGRHDRHPQEAWNFLGKKDRDKVAKAGYATPRGGAKGAYQNHVYRNNRVIIPYERLSAANLKNYKDGYVIRLLPDQYFESAGKARAEFGHKGAPVVGVDAFVLYRTHQSLKDLPPPASWEIRGLTKNGAQVSRRGIDVADTGHYVLRLSQAGAARAKEDAGPPQGIFAPEYADAEVNYLCKAMLVWLIVHTKRSPYTSTQAAHVHKILRDAGLMDDQQHEFVGVIRNGLSACPLCLRILDYKQLHETVSFSEIAGLTNAGTQIAGATRSTAANLFHLVPLVYGAPQHAPSAIGWGHATCNTLLGQRRCYSLAELQELDLKLGVVREEGVLTIGWMSEDFQMIRSPAGAVWVQLCGDMTEAERRGDATPVPQLSVPELEVLESGVDGAKES